MFFVVLGYGLTESTATASISDPQDLTTGHVGPPLEGVDIKIVNWEEGGYTVQDACGPRGEIMIGGMHIAKGYYNMPEKTREDFFTEDGKQYFKTGMLYIFFQRIFSFFIFLSPGDIGQILENGSIKIIDRKKDLVKLQAGEYVSLGKVESNLKIHPIVENICLYAESSSNATVALVTPDEELSLIHI